MKRFSYNNTWLNFWALCQDHYHHVTDREARSQAAMGLADQRSGGAPVQPWVHTCSCLSKKRNQYVWLPEWQQFIRNTALRDL